MYTYTYLYIWDYGGHQLRLKSAQVHHHSPAGTFTRACGVTPRDPGDPLLKYIVYNIVEWWPAPPRSFTSMQTFHTHTHTLQHRVWKSHERKMRMTKYEGERSMKMRWELLNRNTGRRTQKKRGGAKRKHQYQHTWPGAGEPWKGKGKEKAEADGNGQRPAEEGEGRTRLNQPTTARPKPT